MKRLISVILLAFLLVLPVLSMATSASDATKKLYEDLSNQETDDTTAAVFGMLGSLLDYQQALMDMDSDKEITNGKVKVMVNGKMLEVDERLIDYLSTEYNHWAWLKEINEHPDKYLDNLKNGFNSLTLKYSDDDRAYCRYMGEQIGIIMKSFGN